MKNSFGEKQKGYAAILIVFVLGMVSLLIGVSLVQTGFVGSLMGRGVNASSTAFYAANSGIEDAIYKIQKKPDKFGNPEDHYTINTGGINADVVVKLDPDHKDDINRRMVESTGKFGNYIRKIKVKVVNTETKPGFIHAIHAGEGGFEMRHKTLITGMPGKGDETGNVFSNYSIWGGSSDYDKKTNECDPAAASVHGSVWAVNEITKLSATADKGGICITQDPEIDASASANLLDYCFINGTPYSPDGQPPSTNCPATEAWIPTPKPTRIDLPEMGVERMKVILTSMGPSIVFHGDCIIDGSGGPNDCSNGTRSIGTMIITGNLIKPSNVDIYFNGPVWVQKNIIFNSGGTEEGKRVYLAPEITEISQLVVADGKIESDANLEFGSNGKAFLLFISTYDPKVPYDSEEFCNDWAIQIHSNTRSVLFFAQKGCVNVQVTAGEAFYGAILGQKIFLDVNSTVMYDPDLQTALFGLTKSGGWQILSFKEE